MAVHLAAVRAMSQIGGPEAHPAVDFIIKNLPNMDEIGEYNMEIFLSMLGPIATDAITASQSTKLTHPVLPTATLWAIKSEAFRGRRAAVAGEVSGGTEWAEAGGMGLDLVSDHVRRLFP